MRIAPWFERYPEIFEQEKKILLEHGFELNKELFAAKNEVAFTGFLPVDPERKLTVSFPEEFPSFPPRVFDGDERPLLRRHHHPGTRQLCLFGPGNARWSAQLTSEAVLAEATHVLGSFNEGSETVDADDVPEPASAVLSYRRGISILVPPPISSLQPDSRVELQGQFTLRCERITGDPNLRVQGLVYSAAVRGRSARADEYYRDLFDRRGSVISGQIFFISRVLSGAELVAEVEAKLTNATRKTERWFCLLFLEQSGRAEAMRLAWLFVRQTAASRYELIETFTYRAADRLARVPALKNMDTKKITIIGCGCLGSKIAANLASSGLEKITLVDRERYEPNNSVRHEVGVNHYGQEKVNALADRLLDLNPAVEITPFFYTIGANESREKEGKLEDHLAKADLIVDTTGSHNVSRWINERAFLLHVPAVFVSVTNGAWAGEIVRIIPGKTACWLCWNSQYRDDPPPGESTGAIFAPGCGQPSFSGSTFDAGTVADIATSIIAATLLPENPGIAKVNGNYLRWVGRNEHDYILKTDILSVEKRTGCAFCDRHA